MQRAAHGTAQTLAQLDWRAEALSFDGKNMHTLTAKNQAETAQNAIICERVGSPQPALLMESEIRFLVYKKLDLRLCG